MLIYSHLRNANKSARVYKPRRGGAGHVCGGIVRRAQAHLKCGTISPLCETVMFFFAGQSRGMWDGWQVCSLRVSVEFLAAHWR